MVCVRILPIFIKTDDVKHIMRASAFMGHKMHLGMFSGQKNEAKIVGRVSGLSGVPAGLSPCSVRFPYLS